jgi:DNA polymerase-3 subunit delta'
VIKESYTSTEQKKYIFICGKRFGIEAQNALLKVLEEPPNNIIFIIVTNSKSVLLPTIHSRLPLIEDSKIEELEKIDFNYHKFDLAFLQNYIKNNRYLSKEDAANYIQSLFLNLSNMEIKLNEYQLEKFSKALKMLDLHVRPINIVSSILLMLLNSKKA